MESFFVSLTTVALAEMGDRTQLLSLMLAARFRQPWAILVGVLVATLANHAIAGILGAWFGRFLTPTILDFAVGVSMLGMGLWTLKPDTLDETSAGYGQRNAFLAALIAFFIAEIGDKTQIATMALAAAYPGLLAVVAGTTCGMMLANVPAIVLGKAFADRLPLRALNIGAAVLFSILGLVFIARAVMGM